jgi:hypothetical protein
VQTFSIKSIDPKKKLIFFSQKNFFFFFLFEKMNLLKRNLSSSACVRARKPANPFVRRGNLRITKDWTLEQKKAAFDQVYGKHVGGRWESPRKAEEEANMRFYKRKGYIQKPKLIRTTENPLHLARTVMRETMDEAYRTGWKVSHEKREAFMAREKKRLWAEHVANQEEKKAYEKRRQQQRHDHWHDVHMRRAMLKAEIAKKNAEERRRRDETLRASRIEWLTALNEEVNEWHEHPEELINRRFVTYGGNHWLTWDN